MTLPKISPGPTGRFHHQVVAITGGARGIGKTYAHRFAGEGAGIVISDLDVREGRRTAAELQELGAQVVAIEADVTRTADAASIAREALETFGRLDVLVNNAGIHGAESRIPYTQEALPDWRRLLDVNVLGPLNCSLACREALGADGGGVIINHSSVAAFSSYGAYGLSKLALNSLTASLARELADDDIRVVGIAPGMVDSENVFESTNEELRQKRLDAQVIRRMGSMDDLAAAALFLASEQASFVTGTTMIIDGGLSCLTR
ncbi:SDR family NAD(P)-dependent oxidoreductase [Rhodococcus sp. WAY2]|uniref:SDR family NAD(P)-dependent oxidoreductase n=1 Tax=Rhodococcus sp. WAY2 TaxID=2663121 RepID=UPI001320224B|nr:SDR family oxidoreductase [Rhodococcus sp. WAY2]QHE73326.1 3-oxoacyl-[acyl-carrier protein] reductase [Rhodococcus sp. WAY2]